MARLLFYGTLAVAFGLAGLVLTAPWLHEAGLSSGDWQAVVSTFAQDAIVQRTALVGAVGLAVTAFVFFRPALVRAKAARARLGSASTNHVAGA